MSNPKSQQRNKLLNFLWGVVNDSNSPGVLRVKAACRLLDEYPDIAGRMRDVIAAQAEVGQEASAAGIDPELNELEKEGV